MAARAVLGGTLGLPGCPQKARAGNCARIAGSTSGGTWQHAPGGWRADVRALWASRAFSPLMGFMDEETYDHVVEKERLPVGGAAADSRWPPQKSFLVGAGARCDPLEHNAGDTPLDHMWWSVPGDGCIESGGRSVRAHSRLELS